MLPPANYIAHVALFIFVWLDSPKDGMVRLYDVRSPPSASPPAPPGGGGGRGVFGLGGMGRRVSRGTSEDGGGTVLGWEASGGVVVNLEHVRGCWPCLFNCRRRSCTRGGYFLPLECI